jgi:hypothetical protein
MAHYQEFMTRNRIANLIYCALLAASVSACSSMKSVDRKIVYRFSDEVETVLLSYLNSAENRNKSWMVYFQAGEHTKINLMEIHAERTPPPSLYAIAKKSNHRLALAGKRLPIVFSSDLMFSSDWNTEGPDGMVTSAYLFGGGFYVTFDGGFRSGRIVTTGFDL